MNLLLSKHRLSEQIALPLGDPDSALPSAKQRWKNGSDKRPWSPFLAAFSEEFAHSAVKILCRKERPVLYDPFVGSGTTLVAAVKLGIKAIGNDLDPVSAIISRARIATNFDTRRVKEILKPSTTAAARTFALGVSDYFNDRDISYAASVFGKIRRSVPLVNESPVHALLGDAHGTLDSEAVALAALMVAALASARSVRGSNPVWHRSALKGERVRTEPLSETTATRAVLLMHHLAAQGFPPRRNVQVICANARNAAVADGSVDAVLTSPPYLNRLDYVVNHLPQLLLLTGLHSVDIELLRSRMTGTTKIVSKEPVDPRVGPTCLALLKRIRSHSSYASSRYYQYIYMQYFNDMLAVFEKLRRQCKDGAHGIMVMQTSYYKDVLVDSTKVFEEMAANVGFRIRPLASEEVAIHYGNLSPVQLKYVPKKRLREWALSLTF